GNPSCQSHRRMVGRPTFRGSQSSGLFQGHTRANRAYGRDSHGLSVQMGTEKESSPLRRQAIAGCLGLILYVLSVTRKTFHLALLMLLASLQAAQGALYGAILGREESGKVAVEWSGTQCESGEEKAVPCVYNLDQAGSGQNESCRDVQLSSEPPLRSLAYSFADWSAIHSPHFEAIF